MVLDKAAPGEIIGHCRHYTGRGAMEIDHCGAALAQDRGVPLSEQAHEGHYQAAKRTGKDPDGGSLRRLRGTGA